MRWKKSELKEKTQRKNLSVGKNSTERKKLKTQAKKTPKSIKSPLKTQAKTQKILNQEPKIGALNANSVLCTNQALSPGFCALNLVNAQNLRALNPGTTVSACVARSFL